MKKFGLYSIALLMLGIGTLNTGCMGSWAITKKVYKWNEHATGNKFVDNGIFYLLCWWFYPLTTFVDFALLNLIEFWSGSNPLAMAPGHMEKGIVKAKDGNTYEMTVTQNRYEMVALTGASKGQKTTIFFTPATQTWSVDKNNEIHPLATIHQDINKVEIFCADGSVSLVDMGSFNAQGLLKGSY
ncbi:MAG: DUF3332 family protein [Bacteroidota bacterium]